MKSFKQIKKSFRYSKIELFFKILKSEPNLNLNSTYTTSTSIRKILFQEKIERRFKINIAFIVLILTVVISVIAYKFLGKTPEQATIAAALSTLLAAIALEEATDNKTSLLKALKSQINAVSEEDLRKKYLDMFFKIIETQSFPK